ncbi:MAG TPA: hypothetical protein VNS60_02745 [Solirubrobacterales bacterium]|nr:hypothetical protein [Solirubrobacterales bacterium]
MKQIRKRLTYANVMSSIAVFLVLGGATAFAASQLGKNSVGSKQLKKNSVTAAKLKNKAVTTSKIADKAVTGAKVADGSLTGTDINAGSLGTVPSANHATSAGSASGLTTLPSGKSESGFYAAGGGESEEGYIAQGITFQQPLAAAIPEGNVEWLLEEQTSPSCPGVGRAAPNHLCLYDNEESEVSLCCIYDFAFHDPAADKNGFIVYWEPEGNGSYVSGEWTVTAP